MISNTDSNLDWRKSSFSGANGNCVELAAAEDGVAMRNSRHPEDGATMFTRAELSAFLLGAKAGEFDDLV